MNVIKRNGELEKVNLNKITARLNAAIKQSPSLSLDPIVIAQKVVNGLYDGVSTSELDKLASETAAYMASQHPDYDALASRLVVSNMHKENSLKFSEVTEELYKIGILNKEYYEFITSNSDALNSIIDYDRDFVFDYFGVQTLRKSYLLKDKKGNLLERPQDMWLRVATFLHMQRGNEDFKRSIGLIKETYDLLSQKYFTHATPTLFNAGTIKPQLSSCFLLDMDSDSINGIYKTLSDCAKISQSAGGIGLAAHKIRAKGSYINGTNGTSNGIVPMLRVFDATARYVDQGGGRRKGSFAIYLEPWHADIFEFLQLKKNTGEEKLRARDLFYAMWIPDLFMERVEKDEEWTLFDPAKAYLLDAEGNRKYLYETHGTDFNELYRTLEEEKSGIRTIKARDLWNEIMVSQVETGTPYILYKDSANSKSNQSNLGTIKSSNLCCIAGDQRIPTNKGLKTAKELYFDTLPNIVVGRSKLEIASRMLLPRSNAEMGIIKTKQGYTHKVTPDHKVWVKDIGWVEAQNLVTGNKLLIQQFEGIWGKEKFEDEAFVLGLLIGDGTFAISKWQEHACLDIWDKNIFMLNRAEIAVKNIIAKYSKVLPDGKVLVIDRIFRKGTLIEPKFRPAQSSEGTNKYRLTSVILGYIFNKLGVYSYNKVSIPDFLWESNREAISNFLEALYICDGTVQGKSGVCITSFSSINYKFLENLQIILSNFGVKSTLTTMRPSGVTSLPNGKGGYSDFLTKDCWRLLVTSIQGNKILESITKIGQYRKNYSFLDKINKDGYEQKLYVDFNEYIRIPNEDAYCLAVDSLEHSWTANGIITKNTEIIEYTSPDEIAVCNLASISLPAFIIKGEIDYKHLYEVSRTVTRNLNKVIDINFYPVVEGKNSNLKHRPIGIGVQGLADLFAILKISFDGTEAKEINKRIFEVIYKGAIDESIQLAKEQGSYSSYKGSKASKGQLQFDLWGVDRANLYCDWSETFKNLNLYGLRNSLLLAPMPTASTSQILGNNECFEPFTSNIYTRRTLAGEFIISNRHLVRELIDLGLWLELIRQKLIAGNGSIQHITEIPEEVRYRYRTVWEMKMKDIIDMSADRGPFICQSQSLNLFVTDATVAKLTSMHFYGWKRGLKTGSYYIRTQAAVDAIKFTLNTDLLNEEIRKEQDKEISQSITGETCDLGEDCISCSG